MAEGGRYRRGWTTDGEGKAKADVWSRPITYPIVMSRDIGDRCLKTSQTKDCRSRLWLIVLCYIQGEVPEW